MQNTTKKLGMKRRVFRRGEKKDCPHTQALRVWHGPQSMKNRAFVYSFISSTTWLLNHKIVSEVCKLPKQQPRYQLAIFGKAILTFACIFQGPLLGKWFITLTTIFKSTLTCPNFLLLLIALASLTARNRTPGNSFCSLPSGLYPSPRAADGGSQLRL